MVLKTKHDLRCNQTLRVFALMLVNIMYMINKAVKYDRPGECSPEKDYL